MQARIFKESWSQAMKNMVASMTDAEYNEWLEAVGKAGKPSDGNGSIPLTDADIERWVNKNVDPDIIAFAKKQNENFKKTHKHGK